MTYNVFGGTSRKSFDILALYKSDYYYYYYSITICGADLYEGENAGRIYNK